MRKSAIAMLVISIILLIAGIVLVSYGVYLNMPHSSVYSYGHGYISYSYRAVWTGHGGAGMPFTEFGRLLFDAGLLSMAVFVILLVHKPVDKELEEKERKADRIDAEAAKRNADDAVVHDTAETAEPHKDAP